VNFRHNLKFEIFGCDILGIMDGNMERCLLVAAWGRLPTAWGMAKFVHLIDGGVLGGDVAQLLGGVPENVACCLDVRLLVCLVHAAFERRRLGPFG
jgi:hypothetical protein